MDRATPVDTSLRSYTSGGARGVVHEADDEKQMQELKISMMKNETRDKVEHPQNYGFTSHVRKESGQGEDDPCAEHFVQFMGGNRSFPVVQNLDDRRYRIRNFKEGEVAVYDDQQQKVHLERKRIHVRSPFTIDMRIIKDEPDEDGHGRNTPDDKGKPSRDQSKDKSKPLSVLKMDKDYIGLLRATDDGKKLTEIVMGDTRITETVYNEKGQPYLVFDMDRTTQLITMTTLREGRPHLEFSLDEENGNFGFENKALEEGQPSLEFLLDDKDKKILISTKKDDKPQLVILLEGNKNKITIHTDNNETEQVFDGDSKTITIHADKMVKIGDRNAERPVALEDSITALGDRIVNDLAKKVMGY